MSNSNTFKWIGGPITHEDFEKILNDLQELRQDRRSIKSSIVDANLKFLGDRSTKLGKPVPEVLLAIAITNQPIGHKLMEEFRQNYAEWKK